MPNSKKFKKQTHTCRFCNERQKTKPQKRNGNVGIECRKCKRFTVIT